MLPTPGKNVRVGVVGALHYPDKLTRERESFYPDAVRLLRRLQRSGRLRSLALQKRP
jgi:hypothetical protein